MKKWRCTVCGYIHEGDIPPEICPVCGVGREFFELVASSSEPHNETPVGGMNPKNIQAALFKITYGLFIVTSFKNEKINGQCANTVFQITGEPMRIALGINKKNLTHEFIEHSGFVGVTILGENDHNLVRKFGYSSGRDRDKFEDVGYTKGSSGVPLLKGGIAFLEGKIISEKSLDLGTHTLYVADVIDGAVTEDTNPMTYAFFRKTK